MISDKTGFPRLLCKPVFHYIKKLIFEKAKFNIEHVAPIKHVKKCKIPAIFIRGKKDSLVQFHHIEKLCKNYAGEYKLLQPNIPHNGQRTEKFLNKIAASIKTRLAPKPKSS